MVSTIERYNLIYNLILIDKSLISELHHLSTKGTYLCHVPCHHCRHLRGTAYPCIPCRVVRQGDEVDGKDMGVGNKGRHRCTWANLNNDKIKQNKTAKQCVATRVGKWLPMPHRTQLSKI